MLAGHIFLQARDKGAHRAVQVLAQWPDLSDLLNANWGPDNFLRLITESHRLSPEKVPALLDRLFTLMDSGTPHVRANDEFRTTIYQGVWNIFIGVVLSDFAKKDLPEVATEISEVAAVLMRRYNLLYLADVRKLLIQKLQPFVRTEVDAKSLKIVDGPGSGGRDWNAVVDRATRAAKFLQLAKAQNAQGMFDMLNSMSAEEFEDIQRAIKNKFPRAMGECIAEALQTFNQEGVEGALLCLQLFELYDLDLKNFKVVDDTFREVTRRLLQAQGAQPTQPDAPISIWTTLIASMRTPRPVLKVHARELTAWILTQSRGNMRSFLLHMQDDALAAKKGVAPSMAAILIEMVPLALQQVTGSATDGPAHALLKELIGVLQGLKSSLSSDDRALLKRIKNKFAAQH